MNNWSKGKEGEPQTLALVNFVHRQQDNGADWGGPFAGVSILLLPILMLYMWLGRGIVEVLTLGAGQ